MNLNKIQHPDYLSGSIARFLIAVLMVFLCSDISPHFEPQSLDADSENFFDEEFAKFLEENGFGSRDFESVQLLDAVISIVQNYYVSESKTTPEELVTAISSQLPSEFPEGKFDDEEDRSRFTVRNHVLELPVNPDYKDLLEFVILLSNFVKQASEADSQFAKDPILASANIMLRGLDAHSMLMNQEEYRELRQGTEGAFGGLGVLVGLRDGVLTVVKPIPRSPAERAGIRIDERIVAIGKDKTFGKSLEELVEFMRGEPGTSVDLTLLRDGAHSTRKLELQREVIQLDSVQSQYYEKNGVNVLVLTIESFSARTAQEVHDAIKIARKKFKQKLSGVVLDLRENPGGLLDQAVQVSDLFLNDGVIVSTEGRRTEVEEAGRGYHENDFAVAVLISGNTASASEIVAGALQDHGRAVVIGQRSFGKGSVQTIFELPNERALKLTVARYYTPKHRSIQGRGIVPDLEIQPVQIQTNNSNLMGSGKYRTERMLHNSLSVESSADDKYAQLIPETFYYLTERQEDEEQNPDRDIEKGAAFEYMEQLVARKVATDESVMRSHALESLVTALPELRSKLDTRSNLALNDLRQKFGVAWERKVQNLDKVKLQIQLGKTKFDVPQLPSSIDVPVRITNKSRTNAERISLVFKAEDEPVADIEKLVGEVPAGKTVDTTVKVPIYAISSSGKGKGRIYISRSGELDFKNSIHIDWTGKKQEDDVIAVEAQLINERFGKIKGTLEPGEHAEIRVVIRNHGVVALNKLQLLVSSLSGAQLAIDGQKITENISLPPGESKTFNLPVHLERLVEVDEVDFAVRLKDPEIGDVKRSGFSFPAQMNGAAPTQKNVAH
jgi:carboxyl-terminal processing protease